MRLYFNTVWAKLNVNLNTNLIQWREPHLEFLISALEDHKPVAFWASSKPVPSQFLLSQFQAWIKKKRVRQTGTDTLSTKKKYERNPVNREAKDRKKWRKRKKSSVDPDDGDEPSDNNMFLIVRLPSYRNVLTLYHIMFKVYNGALLRCQRVSKNNLMF